MTSGTCWIGLNRKAFLFNGIGGYAEIIKDSKHEEHESMMEWLGGKFDPNAFDIEKVNTYLQKLKWPRTTENQLAKVLMERDDFRG